MSLLEITNLSHSFSENVLYKNADFSLNKKEHVGIVGQNGTGKSTLIKLCTGQLLPDDGRVTWQSKTSIGYLDQYAEINLQLDMKSFLKTAFLNLYDLEEKMNYLYENMQEGDFQNLNTAARYQEELERQDFYLIDTKIEQVATGLGLLAIGLDRPIAQMSGGQRAKVILAKLLLEKPDVLLLDEPTNFLDKEHVDWLSEYLCGLNNAFMVVSHDYAFLEKISNRICDIDNHKITKYYGTYSEFLRKKTALREDYIRQYSAQQKEIKKTEEFIRKNIAGRKSKMARGRQKQLDRMDNGSFSFSEQVKLRYFEQDLHWENEEKTPIQIVSDCYPSLTIKEVRKNLACCGIMGEHAMQAIGTLSGGEQAKVKICLLILTPCNFIIMDEPTNHLDIQAKQSLKIALKEFKGTVLLVSHEPDFYKEWVQKIISIENIIKKR